MMDLIALVPIGLRQNNTRLCAPVPILVVHFGVPQASTWLGSWKLTTRDGRGITAKRTLDMYRKV